MDSTAITIKRTDNELGVTLCTNILSTIHFSMKSIFYLLKMEILNIFMIHIPHLSLSHNLFSTQLANIFKTFEQIIEFKI